MKTEEYVEKYRTFLRNGRAKVKLLAKAEKEMNEEKVANERRMEEEKVLGAKEREEQKVRKGIEIEEQIFQEKLDSEIENFGEVKEIDEIKANCSRFEILSDDYYKLLARAKLAFDQAFVKEYKEIFDKTLYKIREQIKTGKLRIKELIAENEGNIAVEKARNNKLAEETFLKEQKFSAEILSNEIEMRSNALVEKCDCVAVESLSDYQVLQCSKNMSVLDSEMCEIFDKVTTFSQIAALCSKDKDELLISPRNFQEKALSARNNYAIKLHAISTARDISEEKLKNASSLNIDLAKFKGYESKLDIYSFRNEFEKLIQPTILQ